MMFSFSRSQTKFESRKQFRYPLQPMPKMAVFSETLALVAPCQRSSILSMRDLEAGKFESIAAPATLLAGADFRGWRPSHPVVVFTGVHHGFLHDYLRNRIWAELGVPAFEQLLGDDGCLIATECEAHSGLHLEANLQHLVDSRGLEIDNKWTGLAAHLETGLCGCGKFGSRIFNTRSARWQAAPQAPAAPKHFEATATNR